MPGPVVARSAAQRRAIAVPPVAVAHRSARRRRRAMPAGRRAPAGTAGLRRPGRTATPAAAARSRRSVAGSRGSLTAPLRRRGAPVHACSPAAMQQRIGQRDMHEQPRPQPPLQRFVVVEIVALADQREQLLGRLPLVVGEVARRFGQFGQQRLTQRLFGQQPIAPAAVAEKYRAAERCRTRPASWRRPCARRPAPPPERDREAGRGARRSARRSPLADAAQPPRQRCASSTSRSRRWRMSPT